MAIVGTFENGWQCLAYNPVSGVSTWITQDPDDPEGAIIEERQNVKALLDKNKAQRNMASDNWKGDGLHSVAKIPLVMMHDKNLGIQEAAIEGDDKYIADVLNDSDYQNLRTKEGNL